MAIKQQSPSGLSPDPQVAKKRYDVCTRTLSRWDEKPELGFPPPIYINGRRYREFLNRGRRGKWTISARRSVFPKWGRREYRRYPEKIAVS
jgi:hypothetical protein